MATKKISPETQTIVLELASKFGPKGFIRKLFGRNKEGSDVTFDGKAKVLRDTDAENTASKIKALPQDSSLSNMLMKIYSFLQKNSEVNKLMREKENNYKEIEESAAQKRHDKLLAALEKLKKNLMAECTACTAEKNSESLFDMISNVFGGVDILKTILKVGTILLTNPFGLAILGAASVISLLLLDKKPEETNKMLQNIGKSDGGLAEAIMDVSENTEGAERRKSNLLSKRPSSKKSFNPIKDAELQKKYLEEVEFDEKTGLTKNEKQQGYTGVDNDGKLVKSLKSNSPIIPDNKLKELPPQTTPSEKLNTAVSQNNDAKINAMVAPPSVSTINNVQTSGKIKTKVLEKLDVPHVRNQEETFQKMILYSTRVV